MKRLISIIIIISMLLLSGCNFSSKGLAVEESDEVIKVTLDNFKGTEKIKIKHENPGECSLYYKTSISEGGVSMSYKEGWLFGPYPMLSPSVGSDVNSGVYIDSSTTTVIITFEAAEATSGEILFCFKSDSSPFK